MHYSTNKHAQIISTINFNVMQEHPILFNTVMLLGILDGTKTQTRRPVKKQPDWPANAHKGKLVDGEIKAYSKDGLLIPAPSIKPIFGLPGDCLWVRETFALVRQELAINTASTIHPEQPDTVAIYKAGLIDNNDDIRWRPSIHMPRWASRISLVIKDISIERIQSITNEDAINEGFIEQTGHQNTSKENCIKSQNLALQQYISTWNKTYKNWDLNPWVWVIKFERV